MPERPYLHEVLLAGFGLVLSVALLLFAGPGTPVTVQVTGATALFIMGVAGLARLDGRPHAFRARLLLAYAATFFFYASVKHTVPSLGLPSRDAWLLAADVRLFGVTPAVWLQRWSTPWVNDVFSASYLAFHAYLHLAMAWAVVGPRARAERFFVHVFSAYVPGIAGYYLVPGLGPAAAFPELFTVPIEGGWLTQLNAAVVASGSSAYDIFPSLHTYITLVLLEHDRLAHPRRFRALLPVAAAILLSTLVLRYHYAVDVLAGALWFIAFRAVFPRLQARWNAPRREGFPVERPFP
ncbi:phosphatidic acid phosphatase [Pyxidicoccus fallax]|uniref:Phosphatidic acid phosphatase n=1 Tax=Pyxidicoccus fallax TaxID=394095 RepID=A0A848LUV4_9BACT|nr:phosphatase PAP2 family protein [Pyxidicoccus fallax]NMO21362.1 phosphatidic acid phosphatase [Pyxidicoccus fallax]NPC82448.1 phosphatidic acid phosphatase [Pyxidicoccus fallax]